MKFLIITHVIHKLKNGQYYAYGPYVKEMNLWFNYVSEVIILAPLVKTDKIDPIELPYIHSKIKFVSIPSFDMIGMKSKVISLIKILSIFFKVLTLMRQTDHIHLRCPGNMGLIGCFAQIFFPKKPKTAKYAGNWDPNSKQPLSYRFQKWLLANRLITKNMKVLVYGNWDVNNSNLKPFFTASYRNEEISPTNIRNLDIPLRFIFVGSLIESKNPILTCEVVKELISEGIHCQLHLYGEGPEREKLEEFIQANSFQESIFLHGNVDSKNLKLAYKKSHFLLFASKSEGWPKAVAEAMFWGCLPITTPVSCVPEMVDHGSRGVLISPDSREIVCAIKGFLEMPNEYNLKSNKAMSWSRQFTLEKFQFEIQNLLNS